MPTNYLDEFPSAVDLTSKPSTQQVAPLPGTPNNYLGEFPSAMDKAFPTDHTPPKPFFNTSPEEVKNSPFVGAAKGAASIFDLFHNYGANERNISDTYTDIGQTYTPPERKPIARDFADKILPKPADVLTSIGQGAGEGAINNIPFGPSGIIQGVLSGGVSAWRNAVSPDTPIQNDLLGAAAGFTPTNTIGKLGRIISEKAGHATPNPLIQSALDTGINPPTAAGIGPEKSFPKTVRLLRESPFSSAIDNSEREGKEAIENAITNRANTSGASTTKEEAGNVLQTELGHPNSSTGWVNDAKRPMAAEDLRLSRAIDPATTMVPVQNLEVELNKILNPPTGAFQMDSGSANFLSKLKTAIQDFGTIKIKSSFNNAPTINTTIPNFNMGTLPLAAIKYLKRAVSDQLDMGLFSNSELAARDLKIIWAKLSDAERSAYTGTPHEAAFNNMQKDWAEYFTSREHIKKLIDQNITGGAALSDLLSENAKGGEKLNRVFNLVPQARGEVASYMIRNMGIGSDGNFNPDTFFKNWNNTKRFSPEAKQAIFGNDTVYYDKLAMRAEEQARSERARNFSGTAGTNEAFRLARYFAKAAVLPLTGAGIGAGANMTGNDPEGIKHGAIAGGAAYGAMMMIGPKLFSSPGFIRLLATDPPLNRLPLALKTLAATSPEIAHEVTAFQNYVQSTIPQEKRGEEKGFLSGGLVSFADGGFNEQSFQNDMHNGPGYKEWYDSFIKRYGEEPNLDDKNYDYRKAWQQKITPKPYEHDDNFPHWPSQIDNGEELKSKDHPTSWMNDFMKETGKDPNEYKSPFPGYSKGGLVKRTSYNPQSEDSFPNQYAEGGSVSEKMMTSESGNNPTIKNPRSSASGLGQFLDTTWMTMMKKHHPEIPNPMDYKHANTPESIKLQKEMIDRYAQENMDYLQRNGISITPGNVYLAHFMGPAGAVAIAKSDPNDSLDSVLRAKFGDFANKIFAANPNIKGMNVAQLMTLMDNKMSGSKTPFNKEPTIKQEPEMVQVDNTPLEVPEEEISQQEELPQEHPGINVLANHPAATPETKQLIKQIAQLGNIKVPDGLQTTS